MLPNKCLLLLTRLLLMSRTRSQERTKNNNELYQIIQQVSNSNYLEKYIGCDKYYNIDTIV